VVPGDPPIAVAYLALGSNLGDPIARLGAALEAIRLIPQTELLGKSSLYRSPAWGAAQPQPDYINAVVAVRTSLPVLALWRATCDVEHGQGRVRTGERNAARTLDIDILLYDNVVMRDQHLTLPHPRMHERAFVLLPLVEIAHDIVIPERGPAATLIQALPDRAIATCKRLPAWS
jgi:2-amino-4-hydroxy-6-hydroxymethyldihydropteridine diphosphokinase